MCCSPWDHKEPDTTEWFNWTPSLSSRKFCLQMTGCRICTVQNIVTDCTSRKTSMWFFLVSVSTMAPEKLVCVPEPRTGTTKIKLRLFLTYYYFEEVEIRESKWFAQVFKFSSVSQATTQISHLVLSSTNSLSFPWAFLNMTVGGRNNNTCIFIFKKTPFTEKLQNSTKSWTNFYMIQRITTFLEP